MNRSRSKNRGIFSSFNFFKSKSIYDDDEDIQHDITNNRLPNDTQHIINKILARTDIRRSGNIVSFGCGNLDKSCFILDLNRLSISFTPYNNIDFTLFLPKESINNVSSIYRIQINYIDKKKPLSYDINIMGSLLQIDHQKLELTTYHGKIILYFDMGILSTLFSIYSPYEGKQVFGLEDENIHIPVNQYLIDITRALNQISSP